MQKNSQGAGHLGNSLFMMEQFLAAYSQPKKVLIWP